MTQAKSGNTVTVNYTGRLDDGSVFDTTANREPLQFALGQDRLIGGFEQALLGMSPGESKTINLAPEEAYGPHRNDLVVDIDRAHISPGADPRVGQRMQLQQPEGPPVDATVTQVNESNVTVDANHPLAGKALTFEISVLEVA